MVKKITTKKEIRKIIEDVVMGIDATEDFRAVYEMGYKKALSEVKKILDDERIRDEILKDVVKESFDRIKYQKASSTVNKAIDLTISRIKKELGVD